MKQTIKLIGVFAMTATVHLAVNAGDLTIVESKTGDSINHIPGALVSITNTANGTGFLGSYSEGLSVGGETAIHAFSQSGVSSASLAGPAIGVYAQVTTNGVAVEGKDVFSGAYGKLGLSSTAGGVGFPLSLYCGVYGNAGNSGSGNNYAGYFIGTVSMQGPLGVTGNVSVGGTMGLFASSSVADGPILKAVNNSSDSGSAAIVGTSANGYGVEGIGGNIGVYAYNTIANTAAYLATAGLAADLYGDVYVHGKISATSFNSTSDRNAKENFTGVDARSVLAKVVALPISKWNFKDDHSARHIGPMAQDFYAAFNIGSDDKHIATVDEDGVALAAIQGLNQKLDERDTEIQDLKQTVNELKRMMQSLTEKK